jgi:hypothetical protein
MSGGATQLAAPPTGSVRSECVEHLPAGATRPELEESFADRGFAGYAVPLSITVKHGKGETVLPEGFHVQRGSDAALALERAGFAIPQVDGGAELKIETQESDGAAVTTLSIPILLLPKEPGDSELTLPPLPISLARASGEILTVCTESHTISALDPTGNETEPEVRPNPDPVPQREEWEAAKQVAWGLLAGVIVGIIVAYLIRQWLRRPRPVPIVPSRHPWVIALEEIAKIRNSTLLDEHRTDEYFDQVSDCVRKYLGARYGFDGLESTTDEMRRILKRVRPPVPGLDEITGFLEECDLVKFARKLPTEEDCRRALDRGEQIIQSTTPPVYAPTLGTVTHNANRRHEDREDRPRPEASP